MTNTYKADITLNEKDSLFDMLSLEKQMAKVYTTALTEGTSKGFREKVKQILDGTLTDQFSVFTMMTEHGYAKVESCPKEDLNTEKTKFGKVKSQL